MHLFVKMPGLNEIIRVAAMTPPADPRYFFNDTRLTLFDTAHIPQLGYMTNNLNRRLFFIMFDLYFNTMKPW